MADYLKDNTNSTAVYVGKLVQTKNPVEDHNEDTHHIDENG
jgi:hypothetical protein